jgi:hypothetical protein
VVVGGDPIGEGTVADLEEVEEEDTVLTERVEGQPYHFPSCYTIFSSLHDVCRGRGRGF